MVTNNSKILDADNNLLHLDFSISVDYFLARFVRQATSILLSLFLICANTNGLAAEIKVYSNNDLGCILRLQGTIEKGDAKIFEEKWCQAAKKKSPEFNCEQDSFWPESPKICLDSPGGSFTEAIEIGDRIHHFMGTAIENGSVCLSACAIIFMAGSIYVDVDGHPGRPDRTMQVGGKLGFHAPDLVVDEGEYTKKQVDEAYKVSVFTTAKLSRRLDKFFFPLSLFTAMYSTPANEMFHIDYVGQAAQWDISITGFSVPTQITKSQLADACVNAAALYDNSGAVFFKQQHSEQEILEHILHREKYPYDVNSKMQVMRDSLGRLTAKWEMGGNLDSTCTIEEISIDSSANLVSGSIRWERMPFATDVRPLEAYMLYPDSAKITDLNTAQAQGQMHNAGTLCAVFTGEKKTDEQACTMTADVSSDRLPISLFVWPSGSRTVITHGDKKLLNGQETINVDTKGRFNECLLNTVTGNTFCYIR